MDAFPAFVPLRGVRVVVAGEGEAADAKARLFEGGPAELVRIAPRAALALGSYAGARLAFLALPSPLDQAAAAAARQAGAWVNVVDRPALSDFQTPSIIDRGAVVGAIGTGGAAPLLASRLRAEWEARWPAGLGALAELLAAVREEVRAALPEVRERRRALGRILDGPAAEAALAGDLALARRLASEAVASAANPTGRLIRLAAPAEPDALTVRDLRLLARADRLVAGPEVAPEVLAHARRDAPRLPTATEAELAAWAGAGETVVIIG